jgi:hypothetical protein
MLKILLLKFYIRVLRNLNQYLSIPLIIVLQISVIFFGKSSEIFHEYRPSIRISRVQLIPSLAAQFGAINFNIIIVCKTRGYDFLSLKEVAQVYLFTKKRNLEPIQLHRAASITVS